MTESSEDNLSSAFPHSQLGTPLLARDRIQSGNRESLLPTRLQRQQTLGTLRDIRLLAATIEQNANLHGDSRVGWVVNNATSCLQKYHLLAVGAKVAGSLSRAIRCCIRVEHR